MNRTIIIKRQFSYPVATVWKGLTDAKMLGESGYCSSVHPFFRCKRHTADDEAFGF